ncbi:VWA domain-containing protein [Globicatella sp. PHS-GS-PNBC-21-1553]|uniref:vWA domain-containing protein n=1 Tax=Globicatella sp. PHS-GS-PNBC-21-1553 TaxID=2885764 RepID=UPI00298F0E25|nr:VWA domain-containing protein [Globicatella sp. PHS-GS-PNBC-21-1553]WPC07714.1 VWA domain-containing protein [Globicatella sp. PHS-GS-PNBC-21-1553]
MFNIDRNSLNEEKLKKEAEENLEVFLEDHRQALTTFTREPSLRYIGSKNLERFVLRAKENILYLPLSSFLEADLDNNEILWHIYYELSLYPDWIKNANYYLNREVTWKAEIDEITYYIYKKINQISSYDNKLEITFVRDYVKREILDFLFQMDKYFSYLRVLETCPIYRDEEEKGKIIEYMKKRNDKKEIFLSLSHHGFSKSFLLWEIYKDEDSFKNQIESRFDTKILSKSIYTFLNKELIKQINQDQGITKRDPLIKSFIYPTFKKFWLEEVDSMETKDSSGDSEKVFEESNEQTAKDKLESTRKDVEESLKEILDQENTNASYTEDSSDKKTEFYGISREELDLYNYYLNQTKAQREAMKDFWKKLIGSYKKEVNIEKNRQAKGKLNVNDLIYSYPNFIEAEQKGNYKELKIFDKNFLEAQNNLLPNKIEISFLIDNSGSMDKEKIDATRKTLAATLLSISDFNRYLQIEAQKTNQKIELVTETWFFGQDHYKVKNFEDTKDLEKSKIISSITKVDGNLGTTDDASCLREIYEGISSKQELQIKNKNEYKIIFEITDGASTFPGATKDIVKKLIETDVEIFAIQIGKINKIDTKTFNYIWNDNFKYPHGLILADNIEKLTDELLNLVKRNLESIFQDRQ